MPTVSVSRRRLLLAGPAAVALACSSPSRRQIVDVREHGAVGDGRADDSAAITAAVQAVRPGAVLRFPAGNYRFAQRNPPAAAAIALVGMSDVDVEFAPDAELIMDNADPQTDTGTSHGVLIRGPAHNIALRNVRIRWEHETTRSLGDGIRVIGYPDESGAALDRWSGPPAPVSRITLSDCLIQRAPQAGFVMAGVSDIVVTDSRSEHTRADGLHFNACRRATISRHTAIDTGDDGLALVTYFADRRSYDPDAQMFAFPELTEWSNTDFAVDNVVVSGSRANGVRIAGAQRVSLTGVTVDDVRYGAAVMIDSATAGYDVDWEYVAARGVRVTGLTAHDCETGVHVLARPPATGDARFADFGVEVDDTQLRRCTNWSVRVESLAGQRLTGVSVGGATISATSAANGNGGVGLANTAGVHLGRVAVEHSQPVTVLAVRDTGGLTADSVELSRTAPIASDDAAPCARLENTDGVIDTLTLRWPAAPASWQPVMIDPVPVCDAGPPTLVVRTVTAEPATLAANLVAC